MANVDAQGVFFLLGGLFALVASYRDWNIFFLHPKARLIVRLFGRNGARVTYAILGIALVVAGSVKVYAHAVFQEAPEVVIRASFPGAHAEAVEEMVAHPIEQQIVGTEGLESFESESSQGGTYAARLRFRRGVDSQIAFILVSNRVALATPLLPQEVRDAKVAITVEVPADVPRVKTANVIHRGQDAVALKREVAAAAEKIAAGTTGKPQVFPDPDRQEAYVVWDVDRQKCEAAEVAAPEVFRSLRKLGPNPNAEALAALTVASKQGYEVPVATLATFQQRIGPGIILRVNTERATRVTLPP